MSSWRDREQRRPEKLSEALRRDTERKWPEDRWLSSAGGGGCDWDRGDEHYGQEDDDGPEVIV